ncbi:MAG: response regulator [Planctomycetota bacterium]|nr:response regulator [Planctomycetota bacterium]
MNATPSNLLVLGDPSPLQGCVVEWLQHCGHRVTPFTYPSYTSQRSPDVFDLAVLCDTTPGQRVEAVCRELKARSQGRTAVVALLRDESRGSLHAFLDAGVDEFVDAPVDPQLLVLRVNRLLALQQAAPAAPAAEPAFAVASDDTHGDEAIQEQKMEAIGRLAGGVAHDFNNLLMIIDGNLELVLGQPNLTAQVRKNAEAARKATDRAVDLTNQLLSFSRKRVLQARVFDLNQMIGEIGDLLRRVIDARIELATSLAHGDTRVNADRSQIEQVILNLAVNARDAMPNGGRMTISTALFQHDGQDESLRRLEHGAYMLLSVADTGVGMDAITRKHVFEPFFTKKGKSKGSGMGLATVYGIVQQSQGTVLVESAPNCGSVFKVYLPCAEATAVTAEPDAIRPSVRKSNETILIVEDEDGVRELLCHTLESIGYRVLTACDGQDGLRVSAAFGETIDLVVTDMVMPNLGGREMVAELLKTRPDVKVIFISGYSESLVMQNQMDHRSIFLPKPFDLDVLASKARALLSAQVQA